jgi:septal ring factor EnvC (AmiA/AmiB activator)
VEGDRGRLAEVLGINVRYQVGEADKKLHMALKAAEEVTKECARKIKALEAEVMKLKAEAAEAEAAAAEKAKREMAKKMEEMRERHKKVRDGSPPTTYSPVCFKVY